MVFETVFQCPSTSSGDSGVSRGFDANELREIWRVSNPTMPPQASDYVEELVTPSIQLDKEEVMKMKCVLVGDGTIGKTSMVVSYTTNGYPMEYIPTAFDNYSVVVTVDHQPINLQLCDTAGQDDFDALRPLCYPSTDIFLLCFSVVNPTSFHNIAEKWLPEIQRHSPSVPIILVGTQSDLRNDIKMKVELAKYHEKAISEAEARMFANALGAVDYIECSALTQKNLKEVFDTAILTVLDHHLKRTLGKKNKDKRKSAKKSGKYQCSKRPDACLMAGEDFMMRNADFPRESKRKRSWKRFCCFS